MIARQERRTKSGNKLGIIGLSDSSGHYETVIFSEGLSHYREFLEPGQAVLLSVLAEVQGEDVRARIQSVEPLDAAAVKVQKGLRVFVRDSSVIDTVQKRLGGKGDGEVALVLMLEKERCEVEFRLPGRFAVSPQMAGASRPCPALSMWWRSSFRSATA